MARRDNATWLADLRAENGRPAQRAAHEDLANYLYRVAYNYLLRRQAQGNPAALQRLTPAELGQLAQDFTQDTLAKLVDDDFALLDQFSGRGNFTSWAAAIAHSTGSRELRRAHWQRSRPLVTDAEKGEWEVDRLSLAAALTTPDTLSPANQVMVQQVSEALQHCLQALPERRREAIIACVVEGQPAEVVADSLDVSAGAVYNLVYRGKRTLKECLGGHGIDATALDVFT